MHVRTEDHLHPGMHAEGRMSMGPEQVPPRVQEAMARLQWQTNGETVEPARDAIDEAVDWYAADLLNQLHTYLLQVRADLIDRLQGRPRRDEAAEAKARERAQEEEPRAARERERAETQRQREENLRRLATNAGDLLLHGERQGGPFQSLNFPGTDRRWKVAPHIEAPIACECGGGFDLSITILP